MGNCRMPVGSNARGQGQGQGQGLGPRPTLAHPAPGPPAYAGFAAAYHLACPS